MFKNLYRAAVIAILCTMPSSAAAQPAPPTQEQQGWDKLSGPSPLDEVTNAINPACHECLWTYAESYNFNMDNPPTREWVAYAGTCCAACKDDKRALYSILSAFVGNEVRACVRGIISSPEGG